MDFSGMWLVGKAFFAFIGIFMIVGLGTLVLTALANIRAANARIAQAHAEAEARKVEARARLQEANARLLEAQARQQDAARRERREGRLAANHPHRWREDPECNSTLPYTFDPEPGLVDPDVEALAQMICDATNAAH